MDFVAIQRPLVWGAFLLSTWLMIGCHGASNTRKAPREAPSSPTPESPPVTEPVAPEDSGTAAPVSSGPEHYTFCSAESRWWLGADGTETCSFSGTRDVAFGAEGRYEYRRATGSIECSNRLFGDPLPNVAKACYFSPPVNNEVEQPQSSIPVADFCNSPRPAGVSQHFASQETGLACSSCHGNDGRSGFAANLPDLNFNEVSLLSFAAIVRNGRSSMPAFEAGAYPQSSLAHDYAFFAYDALCGSGLAPSNPISGLSCQAQGDLLPAQLRRLTGPQFKNTVEAVFGTLNSDSIWPDFEDGIPTVGMSNNADALRINAINLEAVYRSVTHISELTLNQNEALRTCANASDSLCITAALDRYGHLLWRRPLAGAERQDLLNRVAKLRANGSGNAVQLEFLVKALLMSPNFLYRSEMGALANETVQLSSYEVASLLAYTLWDGPPDAILYNLAADNALSQASVIEAQVIRMIAEARFDSALESFYRDYLKLDRVLSVSKLPELSFTASQRLALLQSARMSLSQQVADRDRDVLDVLAVDDFFVNADIAPLFGLQVAGDQLQSIMPPTSERNGLLTHPTFLSVHSKEGGSGIVKRGVFTLEQLLCVELGDPPDDITEAPIPPELNRDSTSTRELLTLVHTSQVPCNGCHVMIDPAGFGYENYDALGRFRTEEKGSVPIDSSGAINLVGVESLIFNDHIEFTNALMSSPTVRSCMARRFLEHAVGQSLHSNACELTRYQSTLSDEQISIRQLALALADLESLRLRK